LKWSFLIFSFLFSEAYAQDFQTEAKALASDLKTSLMNNLSEKIANEGPVKAISFCYSNVKPIAKSAAGDRIARYDFGRTSHKIRNENNRAQPWAEIYLKEFQGIFKGDIKKEFILHKLENGKQVYLEPLYVQAQCLVCHGDQVSKEIEKKVSELYPKDLATGFKLNEFRGFIWIKEK
jgi:hypothetical protein